MSMLNRWVSLNNKLLSTVESTGFYLPGYAEALFEKAFEYLNNRYSEQHRKYHNLSHIYSCLSFYDQVENLLLFPQEVEMALWLHDIVYNPARQDNEEKSAEFVRSLTWLKPESSNIIQNLILLTNHVDTSSVISDAAYFLDIDLTILGSALDVYAGYTKAIRVEYAFVPEEIFSKSRIKVLESLLENNPDIYHTDYFKERYTNRAISNIKSELKQLYAKA